MIVTTDDIMVIIKLTAKQFEHLSDDQAAHSTCHERKLFFLDCQNNPMSLPPIRQLLEDATDEPTCT